MESTGILLKGHQDIITDVEWSPDGKLIASASRDNKVRLWDKNGTLIKTFRHADHVNSICWSPNGELLASTCWDKLVRIWDRTGNIIRTLQGHCDGVNGVSWSPDSKLLVTSSYKVLRIWDNEGKCIKELYGHTDVVRNVAWSTNGELIASASFDKTIRLWTRAGILVKVLTGHNAAVEDIAWAHKLNLFASASYDNTVKLWDHNGNIISILKGHLAPVVSVAWAHNGDYLASASYDKTIRIWNHSGDILEVLKDYSDPVICVAWSPDSELLASASLDNIIRFRKISKNNLKINQINPQRNEFKNNHTISLKRENEINLILQESQSLAEKKFYNDAIFKLREFLKSIKEMELQIDFKNQADNCLKIIQQKILEYENAQIVSDHVSKQKLSSNGNITTELEREFKRNPTKELLGIIIFNLFIDRVKKEEGGVPLVEIYQEIYNKFPNLNIKQKFIKQSLGNLTTNKLIEGITKNEENILIVEFFSPKFSTDQRELIELATKNNGVLTIPLILTELKWTQEHAKRILDSFTNKRIARCVNSYSNGEKWFILGLDKDNL